MVCMQAAVSLAAGIGCCLPRDMPPLAYGYQTQHSYRAHERRMQHLLFAAPGQPPPAAPGAPSGGGARSR